MEQPTIIFADVDKDYIYPLAIECIKSLPSDANVEIITNREYFNDYFSRENEIDLMVIHEQMYSMLSTPHPAQNIVILKEDISVNSLGMDKEHIRRIYRYSTLSALANAALSTLPENSLEATTGTGSTKIITVSSAGGGTGKTVLSMAMAQNLSLLNRKVLYINAAWIQDASLYMPEMRVFTEEGQKLFISTQGKEFSELIPHLGKTQSFYYLPLCRGPLLSLGKTMELYINFANAAAASKHFQYIIIDTESVFDQHAVRLMGMSSKVVLLMNGYETTWYKTEQLLSGVTLKTNQIHFVYNEMLCENERIKDSLPSGKQIKFSAYVRHVAENAFSIKETLATQESVQSLTYSLM